MTSKEPDSKLIEMGGSFLSFIEDNLFGSYCIRSNKMSLVAPRLKPKIVGLFPKFRLTVSVFSN